MASVNRVEGAHCSLAVQPEYNIFVMPEGVDVLEGVGAKLAAIAHRTVRLSQARMDETVAVVGLGAVGLTPRPYRRRVIGMGLSERRAEIARKAGIEAFVPQGRWPIRFSMCGPRAPTGRGCDWSPVGPGVGDGTCEVEELGRFASAGSRVIIQGSYPSPFTVPYSSAFMKELSLWVPHDSQPRDIRAMPDLLMRRRPSLAGIISAVRAPETAAETYVELITPSSQLMTVAFKWS